MGTRKFYYGDIGEILAYPGSVKHTHHRARIVGTEIRISKDETRSNVRYNVNCECGKDLNLNSRKMRYIQNPDPFPTPEEACYNFFLWDLYKRESYNLGVVEKDEYPDRNEIDKRIATLKPRWQDCLRRYYGLNSEGKRETLQPIGDSYGLSRERIRQMIVGAMGKLYLLHHGMRSQREAIEHYMYYAGYKSRYVR